MMNKVRTLILTLLCLMLSSVVLAAANVGVLLPQPTGKVNLDFYSLNDFRGRVTEDEGAPGAARLAGIIRSLARQNVFGTVFLGGSNMVYGYAPSDKMNGSPAQVALNGMGITADVVNAGTFTHSPKRGSGSGYITLGANVLDASGNVAKPFKPSIILSRNGVDVGIVGLAGTKEAALANAANMDGYKIVPPEEVAQKSIDEVRKYGAQVVILLVSMESRSLGPDGVQGDITGLLSKLHGVDGVITTANTSIVTGTYNGVPVVQAGSNARTLGRIHLTYDRKEKKVTAAETRTYDVDGLPLAIDMETAKNVDKALPGFDILKTAKEENKQIIPTGTKGSKGTYVIGRRGVAGAPGAFVPSTSSKNSKYLPKDVVAVNEQIMTNDIHGESLIGEYCTSLLKDGYKADVALYNATSFHAALDTGSISYKNLERIFPDKTRHIIIGEIYGSELKQAVEHGLNKDIGLLRFAGLKVVADLRKPEGQRIQSIKFTNGDAVLDEQVYNVVMNDYMYKGNEGYTMLTNARAVMDKGAELDFFKFAFRAFRTINYGGDGRLQLME